MGWDAFGLPAERLQSVNKNTLQTLHKETLKTLNNKLNALACPMIGQEKFVPVIQRIGWTQWIFLLYEKGLAYLAEVPVNWCPAQGTVLANEEVVDGKYVETGELVEKRIMRQWMLKITAYADRLLDGLEGLNWPKNVIDMQKLDWSIRGC